MSAAKATCPNCGHKIHLERHIKRGDWIDCSHCKAADIEVISLDPPMLDWAYEESLARRGRYKKRYTW